MYSRALDRRSHSGRPGSALQHRGRQVNPQLSRVTGGLPHSRHCWWCFPRISGGSHVSVLERPTPLCIDWKHSQSFALLPLMSQACVPGSCAGTAPHPAVPSALCTGHASNSFCVPIFPFSCLVESFTLLTHLLSNPHVMPLILCHHGKDLVVPPLY